jgi:RNA polymerase sigma-70 factor (ECF subfamily)
MTDGAATAANLPTDSELMSRVRDGEIERLSELFERHHRRLYHFFYRLAGETGAAEDLVQEVFVRLIKYRHTFRDDARFTPWMFAMARNAGVDHFRKRPKELPELEDAAEPAAPFEHPVELLEQRERSERLQAALGRLPEEKRELLLLARFGEMRYERIGELLGISVGAVKVRVHRALKELRKAYLLLDGEGAA